MTSEKPKLIVLRQEDTQYELENIDRSDVLIEKITVKRAGGHCLNGTINTDVPWLVVDQNELNDIEEEGLVVMIRIIAEKIPENEAQASGRITIRSNGGTEIIPFLITLKKNQNTGSDEAPSDENNNTPQGESKNDVDPLSALLDATREHSALLHTIKGMIEDRLTYDQTKELAFKKLYDEMTRQQGFTELVDRNLKPLITDLILLYDSMKKFETSLSTLEKSEHSSIKKNFSFLIDDLEEALYRQEVELLENDDAEVFNSKYQKAIKTITTDNEDEHLQILEVVRQGFMWRDKILRPQEVIIKKINS